MYRYMKEERRVSVYKYLDPEMHYVSELCMSSVPVSTCDPTTKNRKSTPPETPNKWVFYGESSVVTVSYTHQRDPRKKKTKRGGNMRRAVEDGREVEMMKLHIISNTSEQKGRQQRLEEIQSQTHRPFFLFVCLFLVGWRERTSLNFTKKEKQKKDRPT
eukprot:gene7700-5402_t